MLLLAGCAATPLTNALLHRSPDALPRAVELTNTPFWPQTRYQCGPAALATVLGAQGVAVTPEELVDQVYAPALRGSLPVELIATARQYDLLAYRLQPSLQDLLREVAAGHPVLVLQNLGLDWLPRWHFAVVIGYDLDEDEILLRSGTTRRWRTTLANFERTWLRAEHWAFVAVPPGVTPVTADPLSYLQAAHDLETQGRSGAAAKAYGAAVRRWPDQAAAWLALGNNRYGASDFDAAVQAFRTATQLTPADPRGWNNLAYALLENGCPREARAAARCAEQRAPDDGNVRQTRAEIDSRAGSARGAGCQPVRCAAE